MATLDVFNLKREKVGSIDLADDRLAQARASGATLLINSRTTDPVEARNCRRAQFTGFAKEITLSGITVSGLVHAVREDVSLVPPRWAVTIIPQEIMDFKAVRVAPTNNYMRAGR